MDTLIPRTCDPARHARFRTTLEGLLAIQATEVRSALDQASALVATALRADKVDILLNAPSADMLVALGTSDTPMGRHQNALGLNSLPLSNGGRAAEVFHRGQPYWSSHVDQDPEELCRIKQALGVRSALIVALDVDGVRRGVLQVESAEPEWFTEDDLAFLEAVAHWVGLIVHRAELVERVTQDAAEQARQSTATELITMLAHDLRVPLTPLQGYLSMMEQMAERDGLDQYREYATRGQRSVKRLERMLTDLLDTTRLEQDLFTLTLEAVNLAALVEETAELLRSPTALIEVRAPGELIAMADATRLRQVVENLLSNALRYSPDGVAVVVEVSTERHSDTTWGVITVHDTGPGIAPELLPQLFTRFTRGGNTAGLGLGLYLSRGIAIAHGGTLTAASTPGNGARFHLTLPLA